MKITRHRRVRRNLNFYKNNFQFRAPFQVLIDSTFCHEALKCKLNIKEQIPMYLEDPDVRLFTTSCVVMEAEMLGPKVYGAMLIVKQFKARKCGHEKNSLPASECLASMIGKDNQDHFIIATQDRELSDKCRDIPGVPLMYVKYNAVILEKPSTINAEAADKKMKTAVEISDHQSAVLKKLKTEAFGEDTNPKKRRRKIKGPNPLSCKKKKPKVTVPNVEKVGKQKRQKPVKNNVSLLEQIKIFCDNKDVNINDK